MLIRLRKRYKDVGCRAAMVALYRKPADLLQSWHSYRSKAILKSPDRRQLVMPGFLSWAAQCGRSNVLSNWLRTNAWSRRVLHDKAGVLQLANMLNQYDIIDELDNFEPWLVRVLDFLQVPRGQCQQVSWVNYTVPVVNVPKILLDVNLPPVPKSVDVCKVNRRAISYLHEVVMNMETFAKQTIPQSTMSDLTRWDRILYNRLRYYASKRDWGGLLRSSGARDGTL
eukprot:scaffold468377_cov50-Prasinocladus_malaysianus.AAC.1